MQDTAPEAIKLERLTKKKQHWGFLEGKDAALYLSLSSVPAPVEKPIDIPSLQLKLSSLLPGERQLDRRARKLAWHLSKGKRVTCDWDNISLSELTPAEKRILTMIFWPFTLTRSIHQPRRAEDRGGTEQPWPGEKDMPSASGDTGSDGFWRSQV